MIWMSDPAGPLKDMPPQKEFFIGIDSDGCVFDTMEIKHKECFCPAFINHFDMQAISKYARQTWEFVNLYSRTRGVNRFIALLYVCDLLRKRKEVLRRSVAIPYMETLRKWVHQEQMLGNPTLLAAIEKNGNGDLRRVFEWSCDVNDSVKKIVRNVPPFPFVRESLEKLTQHADAVVVSSTPCEALKREWIEHRIADYVRVIAGQEMGKKDQHIRYATKNRYAVKKVLMVGDSPEDLKAAQSNNALFYPIIPGKEEASWQCFYEEALDRFFESTYEGEYEQQLIRDFEASLPEHPEW
jgi:phosphoglycolate phosphatase-like HAD superfamily hydrolase